jgi:hypothetical protein
VTATLAPLAIDNKGVSVQLSIGNLNKGRNMLTLDKIKHLLADRRLDIVSKATGIHRNTLGGIRDGRATNPTYDTIRKLSEYFQNGAGADAS